MKLEAMTPHLARASLQSKTFRRASRPISRNALASGFFVQIQPQSQEKETGRKRVAADGVNSTQAQTSTGRRVNTPKSTQAQKCEQAGRPLLAKSISGLVFQYRQSSKRDPQRRRNTTQPFRSTWLRYRRTPYSDLVHRARPVCEKFPISRKKESLQSGLHVPREESRAQERHGRGITPKPAA